MPKFLLKLSGFVAIQLLIGAVVIATGPDWSGHYLAAGIDKERMLTSAATPSPRIIFVGGSNLAFGLDSTMVAEQLGRHPVNLGHHAGLGLGFMLNQVEAHVQAGDVVVLSLEYDHLMGDMTSEVLPLYLLKFSPRSVRYLDAGVVQRVMDSLWICLGGQSKPLMYRLTGMPVFTEWGYARESFNLYGDLTFHHNRGSSFRWSPDIRALGVPAIDADAARRLKAFAEACHRKNAVVYLSFAPLPQEQYELASSYYDSLPEQIDALGLIRIDEVKDALYPSTEFFDTSTHLAESGKRERTARLIDRLKMPLASDELVNSQRPGSPLAVVGPDFEG